jgi:deoxyribodipyrimidine photo-lyase
MHGPVSLERLAAEPRIVVRHGDRIDPRGQCVVYRMRRSQRAFENCALETAIGAANAIGQPVVVFFGLLARHTIANRRHYAFMIEGLAQAAHKLVQRRIGFVLRICEARNSQREFARFCAEVRPSLVIADEDPARRDAKWIHEAALYPSAPLWSVDADVIVPSKLIGKEQFAARTIRPRIRKLLCNFLVPATSRSVRVPWTQNRKINSLAASRDLIDQLHLDSSASPAANFQGGTDAAIKALRGFIRDRLANYADGRNHPEIEATSQLSPYLHFGQIGPQTVALAIGEAAAPARNRDAFLEELIVRRELAVNFVRYNPRYKTLASAEPWARRTLDEHARDKRLNIYSETQLANAQTHDPLWNAAQRQMVSSGWMHGYMRMYWAKKILEWSPGAEAAYDICVRLNDRYQLDGRDPNGYAGIAWAIGGKHDRAWGPERPIYGKVRYMSLASSSRKFNSRAYIEKWNR